MNINYDESSPTSSIIDLSSYRSSTSSNDNIFVITSAISEITLTSNNLPCSVAVYIKPRNNDLTININNLYLKCSEEIAMNFAASTECCYTNHLVFSGVNLISSDNNIGICISNGQSLNINGRENGILKISGGSSVPAMGNNYFSSGSGHLIFSGQGDVEITGGLGNNNSKQSPCSADISACAICFSNDEEDGESSIEINDEINVSVHGEDGENLSGISLNNYSGKGGCAICINAKGSIKKTGSGLLILEGGNGGDCTGSYSCGICSSGGDAIRIGYGSIDIKKPASFISGNGGNAKIDEHELIISKGGCGGDIISICEESDDVNITSKIIIDDDIEVSTGNGGNSGFNLTKEGMSSAEGGDSGNFIRCISKAEAYIGKVNLSYGTPGSCILRNRLSGKTGKTGSFAVGKSINFHDYNDSKENNHPVAADECIEETILCEDQAAEIKEEKPVLIPYEDHIEKEHSFLSILKKIFYID